MVEIILLSSVILSAVLVQQFLSSVEKHKDNNFAYSRNEAKAACNFEDYKLANRKLR